MATSSTSYQGGLRTQSTHIKSGNQIITDAPTDNHGKGDAFSPTDLVATALTSCMMTIMGIVASREGIDLKGLEAETTKHMGVNPRRITKIEVSMSLDVEGLSDKQVGILKKAALTCPVAMSLDKEIEQVVTFEF